MWVEYGRILWVGAGSAKKKEKEKAACRRNSQKVYWLLGTSQAAVALGRVTWERSRRLPVGHQEIKRSREWPGREQSRGVGSR